MAINVIAILGSARRNGNSAQLLNKAISAIDAEKANIREYRLGEIRHLEHCSGCKACRSAAGHLCAINDGLNEIIERARESDVIIIACPVVFASYNSLTKAFIDRLFYSSGIEGRKSILSGKKACLLVTYDGKDVIDSGAKNILQSFYDMTSFCGVEVMRIIEGSASEDLGPSERVMQEAIELGRAISSMEKA